MSLCTCRRTIVPLSRVKTLRSLERLGTNLSTMQLLNNLKRPFVKLQFRRQYRSVRVNFNAYKVCCCLSVSSYIQSSLSADLQTSVINRHKFQFTAIHTFQRARNSDTGTHGVTLIATT